MTQSTNSLSSPAGLLIGSERPQIDAKTGEVTMRFTAPHSFASPRGFVQGGLIGGFLDEVMGAALYALSKGQLLPLNLETKLSLIRPVPLGGLIGKGRVVKQGRRIVFLEGDLLDLDGNLLARASSTAVPTPIPDNQIAGNI